MNIIDFNFQDQSYKTIHTKMLQDKVCGIQKNMNYWIHWKGNFAINRSYLENYGKEETGTTTRVT